MGEIAEMMLDGTMCEGCGEFLDGEGAGYPRYCSPQCARDRGAEHDNEALIAKDEETRRTKINCPTCGKLVKRAGVEDHRRDVHGWKP